MALLQLASDRARQAVALGAAGSAATLLGAFGFQYLGNMPPCPLCIWQRWPHAAAVLLGIAALTLGRRLGRTAMLAGAGALLVGVGIAAYHVGIEQGWWQGPTSCTAPQFGSMTPGQMLDALRAAPVVRCDEIPWSLAGVSMAGWNALVSLGLAGLFAYGYASSSASQYR